MIKVGFIGSGDWGMTFLGALAADRDVAPAKVLTVTGGNRTFLRGLSPDVHVSYYESMKDYDCLLEGELSAIVMAGWPRKITPEFIRLTRCPFVNIHGSLLPKYRGPEPIIQQLLHNETIGGVTIHLVGESWDDGPICAQDSYEIQQDDNNRTLFFKAARCGMRALSKFTEMIKTSTLSLVPQEEKEASYYRKVDVMDYVIDENFTRDDVVRVSRAFAGQYPVLCRYHDEIIRLIEFQVQRETETPDASVRLRDGSIFLKQYARVNVGAV